MRTIKLALVVAAVATATWTPSQASAWLKFCNRTSKPLFAPGWTYSFHARSFDWSLEWHGGGANTFWMPSSGHNPWRLGWPNGPTGNAHSHRSLLIRDTNQIATLVNGNDGACCDIAPGCTYSGGQCLCSY